MTGRRAVRERCPAQLTVFVSLIMMCLFTVFCVLVESARTAGARWYVQMAADSALDSVFSQYHRQLWDSYRLLFAEYEDAERLAADFTEFLYPYMQTDNWYPLELSSVQVEEWRRAADDHGIYLEREILDYMKYGIWDLDVEADQAKQLLDSGREAESVTEVAGAYRGHAKEALKLEKALEAISANLEAEREIWQQGLSCLTAYDGPGFRRNAEDMIRQLRRIPGLVETYRRRADELARGLARSRTVWEDRRQTCSAQAQQLLEQEIHEYESYVSAEGARRQEAESLHPWAEHSVIQVQALIEEALEAERTAEEWEDSDDEDDAEEDDGSGGGGSSGDEEDSEEDGDDGPDLEEIWNPVLAHAQQLRIPALSFRHGVKDKEKESWLNQVEQMYRAGLLEMLIPEQAQVSERRGNLREAPSRTETAAPGARGIAPADHLLVNAYCGEFFSSFCEERAETEQKEDGVLAYEMEYLIGSRETDEENLSVAVHRLLAIREGLNLAHILTDASKREAARGLALAVTGLAAVTPLVFVTAFFIMSVWALGEALMDIRGLLAGKRIPLLKRAEYWTLDIGQLLAMGSSREIGTGGGENGFSYLSWLKILLFLGDIVQQEYRMMDVMQMNLRVGQDSFRIRNGVYQVRLRGELCGKHVFYAPAFVESLTGKRADAYPMEVSAERVY